MIYFFYHLRWQLSTLVMYPFMYIIESHFNMNSFLKLSLIQLFGAIIFWNIDKLIFKDRELKKCSH